MKFYAVIIRNQVDSDCAPWVSVFDSEEKRGEFMDVAGKWIQDHDLQDTLILETDSGRLNSATYLELLEIEYGE